jgi:hypothetical protein
MTDQQQEDRINWKYVEEIASRLESVGPGWRLETGDTKLRHYSEVISRDYAKAAEIIRALQGAMLKAQQAPGAAKSETPPM